MIKVIKVINDYGLVFNVRLVEYGESYGRTGSLTHNENDPLVEFYDDRYKEDPVDLGQFISRYYASTLSEHYNALWLYADVDDWIISEENMRDIREWISAFINKF